FSAATVDIDGSNYGKLYPPKAGAAALPRPNPRRETPEVAAPVPPSIQPIPEHGVPGPWLDAIRDIQRHTAEAHQAAQKAISDAHIAYLQSSQTMIQDLYTAMQGDGPRRAPETAVASPLPVRAPEPVFSP